MQESKEEKALAAKNGEREALISLWREVRRFCYRELLNYARRVKFPLVDKDDILQCAYFGFLYAVRAYEPKREFKFMTYLSRCLKAAVRDYAVIKKDTGKETSGDEYITGSEEITVFDAIPDKNAEAAFFRAERFDAVKKIYEAITALPNRERLFILLHYFGGATYSQIAAKLDVKQAEISAIRKSALKKLRRSKGLRGLYEAGVRLHNAEELARFEFSISAEAAAVRRIIAEKSRDGYISYGKRMAVYNAAFVRFVEQRANKENLNAKT